MRKLIKNANVFNGRDAKLLERAYIVLEDGFVREIAQGDVTEGGFDEVVDAGGRTALPGLVDAHVHLAFTRRIVGLNELTPDEIAIRSTRFAKEMLLRGFTTVRDAFGMVLGLKNSIDNGFVDGPRIFPSYAGISQTSGHGDYRANRAQQRLDGGEHTSPFLRGGHTALADGEAEVLRAARENLFLGASQIKICSGGGFSSQYDFIFTTQLTEEETRAAVRAAEDYGTYVMTHLYTAKSIARALRAGVKSLEHATMLDEETARMAAANGAWICSCPQIGRPRREGDPVMPMTPERQAMLDGEKIQTELINKLDLNLAFGTDCMRWDESPVLANPNRQLEDFSIYKSRFGSLKGLRAATGAAHDLLALSTYQNPYRDGKIGLLEQGAFADLLLVDGNPAEDLDILANPDNTRLIMKAGAIYKNTL